MTVMDILVAAGLTATGATFIGWLIWDGIRHWRAQPFEVVFTSGTTNDDNAAVKEFIKVVQHATKNLIVHDDGNKMHGTIYDNPEAIEALDRQMNEHQDLVVKCLFNDNTPGKLKMVEELRQRHPERFKVKYRRWPWSRPAFDVHYKIADDGAFGHLSHHAMEGKKRHFEVRDCSAANQTERNIEHGKYMRRFKWQFRLASAA